MTRWTLIVCVAMLGICQTKAFAFSGCPGGYVNEIFCEDFDVYCTEVTTGDHHPWEAADNPQQSTKCPTAAAKDPNLGDRYLHTTWYPTSIAENSGNACGTQYTLEDIDAYTDSLPFGGRYPCQGAATLGQQTFRDWTFGDAYHAPPATGSEGWVFDMHRLIGSVFGSQYAAVAGTDGAPLVYEFFMNGETSGKISWDVGYQELALDTDTANTDYILSPACVTYCSPGINQGPFPILCAQGNPQGAMPGGCPSVTTYPPPVHAAIAAGAVAIMDTDPCHCGVQAHGAINWHLVTYDGQKWWSLRPNSPVATTGTVVPKGSAPMPPPSDISLPGDFALASGNAGKSAHTIVLTVKTSTYRVDLTTFEKSVSTGNQYWVSSSAELPRAYTGPFDTVRGGVGIGCPLQNNNDWTTCDVNPIAHKRKCLDTNSPNAGAVIFDDMSLHGGVGYSLSGACCLPNASCIENVTQATCGSQGGVWQGSSTTCGTVSCCPIPFADADHDGDVDQNDFGMFQLCYTGSTTGGVPAGCECFNRNGDGGIDGTDYTEFSRCFAGANVTWSQSLTPSCTP